MAFWRLKRVVLVAFKEALFVDTLGSGITEWDSEQSCLGSCPVSFLKS
jgi:hypothetical protein